MEEEKKAPLVALGPRVEEETKTPLVVMTHCHRHRQTSNFSSAKQIEFTENYSEQALECQSEHLEQRSAQKAVFNNEQVPQYQYKKAQPELIETNEEMPLEQ